MQDIPKNELLDKLAAGWKCRRKSWMEGCAISEKENTITAIWWQLLQDDWEGEPPEQPKPSIKYNGRRITFAFAKLKCQNAEFIRRSSWRDQEPIRNVEYVTISVDDILAYDWEVWG